MEISLSRIINYFLTSLCVPVSMYVIGCKLVDKKIDFKNFANIMYTLMLSILSVINYFFVNNPFRIIISYFLISLYYKLSLNQKIRKSMILGFIMMVLLIFSEITISIVITIVLFLNKNIDGNSFLVSSIVNIIIAVLSLLTFKVSGKMLKNIVEKYTNKIRINIIFVSILIILVIGALFMSFLSNNWKMNGVFYFDTIIILFLIIISGILLLQEYSKINLLEKYEIANKYMKINASLIKKYSSIQHQYKNQLILIKGYADKKNDKLISYINKLLKDYKYKKYEWITKVNNINLESLRYLIFYKLTEAENTNLKLDVQISEKIKKINLQFLSIKDIDNLSIIIGEYLENAIHASKDSDEKELYFDSYLEDNSLIIEISNSYNYSINIDMNNISKRGYSTKGENRGLGLYEIDKIISSSSKFKTSRIIKDNYFIAKLIIDIKNSR